MQLNFYRLSSIQLVVGADTVIFGVSVPSDSVITGVRGKVHMIGEEINWKKAALYAVDGYLIGTEDPDTPDSYGEIWDRFVPKAAGWSQNGLEIDTTAQDTLSFYEPGEATLEDIMMLGNLPERVFKHRGFRTVVNNPGGYNFVASDASTFFPVAEIPLDIKKKYGTGKRHSNLIFAGASPLMTDVTTTQKLSVTKEVWAFMKFAGTFLEYAYLALLGEVETGAETPYLDVMQALEEELNPPILEATAGDFDDMVYQVFGAMNVQVTVPGHLNVSSLALQS